MTADRATISRLASLLLFTNLVAGCAAKTPPATSAGAVPSALETARAALRDAEAVHAEEQAPESYRRALESLRLAEAGSGSTAREAAIRAEGFARVASAEARCATSASSAASTNDASLERAQAELKQAREDNRRLEERTALLQHSLEQTETELIRSKARLRGIETKAEAASAIAEARILLRRLNARGTASALCRDSVRKAERQLDAENYGAALSFALRAQDIANQALAAPSRP
jgi:hypothetical protein